MSAQGGRELIMVLVTGASGFVGSALLRRLTAEGRAAKGGYRNDQTSSLPSVLAVNMGDLGASMDCRKALKSVNVVVHAAARVHVMRDTAADPLTEFRRVNVDGTLSLARQAAEAGVQRFIFLSSIKVNGEATQAGHAFSADDLPAPEDPYGISKYEAEQGLRQLADQTGIEVVIVRLPLVYGPGVKANFERMMRWVARGVPLPLGAISNNRRSLLALDNLVDLLCICLRHPAAAGRTLMAADGEDLSTADLLCRLAQALGVRARLFNVPPGLLDWGALMLGKQAVAQRLFGNLQVDIRATCELLGWQPPLTVDQGLQRTVQGKFR